MDLPSRGLTDRRKLGQMDSFNSSGATIVPEGHSRTRLQHDFPSSQGSSSGGFGSQNSMGRLDRALASGDQAMTQLLEGQANGEYDQLINAISNLPPDESMQLASQTSMIFDMPTFATDEPMFQPMPDTYPQTTSPMNLITPSESPVIPQTSLNNANGVTPYPVGGFVPAFRPQSAQSYHSNRSHATSISGSEFSYTSTEVSEDYDMGDSGAGPSTSKAGVPRLRFDQMDIGDADMQSWNRGVGIDPAAAGPSGGIGPIRGGADEEERRKAKLEHRRQINRKSAQKHRQRRREESETLNKAISERDFKILQLEKDLAVERARLQQLMQLVKTGLPGRAGLLQGQGSDGDMTGGGNGSGQNNRSAGPGTLAGGSGAEPLDRRRSLRRKAND